MGFNSGFKGLKYSVVPQSGNIQSVPLGTEPGIYLIILPLMRILHRNV